MSSHARAMNEAFKANNSDLRWNHGELWPCTLWGLCEEGELFGAYELKYWREKGDLKVLEIAEKYYEEWRKRMAKKNTRN